MLNTIFFAAAIVAAAAPNTPVNHQGQQKILAPQSNAPVLKPQAAFSDEKQAGEIKSPTSESIPSLVKNYNHPGVIARQGSSDLDPSTGEWVGGDHLINLPRNIPVQVDLSLPKTMDVSIQEHKLKQIIEEIFKKYDLNPDDYVDVSAPPLPYFNILITVYQVPKGYVYVVEARLFEAIKLDRVAFDEGVALQAITWEMTSLNGVPEDKLLSELNQSVAGMATTFAQRYNYFKKIEQEQKK